MTQPTSAIRQLSACPILIGNTLEYLGEDVIVRCDINAYLALQRAIDTVWAAETRRIMKKALQRMQAALARKNMDDSYSPFCEEYGVKLVRNPIFVATLDLFYMSLIFQFADIVKGSQNRFELCEFLAAYADQTKHKFDEAATYPLLRSDCVVRGRPCKEHHDDGFEKYYLLKDVEYFTSVAGRESSEWFSFAFARKPHVAGLIQVVLFSVEKARISKAKLVTNRNTVNIVA
jgi:hypothetical protein